MFGEDRLQCAPARQPAAVLQVEQVGPQQITHLGVDAVALHLLGAAAEDVTGRARGGRDDDRRHQPPRAQVQPGHVPAGVTQGRRPGVEHPDRGELLA